jgi:hypothetical protein
MILAVMTGLRPTPKETVPVMQPEPTRPGSH